MNINRRVLIGALCIIGLAAALSAAPAARAGEFKVPLCNPDLNPAHKLDYQRNSDRYKSGAVCDGGGNGLQVSFDGPSSSYDKWGRWLTTIPAGLTLRAYNVKAHIKNDGGHVGRVCVNMDNGNYDCRGTEAGSFQNVSWDTGGGRNFTTRLGCFKSDGCEGGDPHIYVKRLLFTLQDLTPPLVDIGGPLFSAGVKSGTQFATVTARDAESGVRSIFVEVNGQAYETLPIVECDQVDGSSYWYRTYRPCPQVVSTTVSLNTEDDHFLDGPNTVRVCVADVASADTGTAANVDCDHSVVDVDNSCPSSTPGGVSLAAGFGAGKAQSTTITYGETPYVSGRLTDTAGDGVAGALVCLRSQDLYEGARYASLGAVRTTGTGSWSMPLPGGPSRAIRAVYRDGANVHDRDLSVFVRAKPPFKLSAKRIYAGACVRMAGALPGPNNRGRVVTLQGRARGAAKWTDFRTATTKLRGAFHKRYCFRATSGSTTYELRALVRQQSRYPYRRGVSKARRIRVVVNR